MPDVKRSRLFVFDLDGTIADSRADMARSVNRVRHLYNLPDLPADLPFTLVMRGMDFLYRACFPEIVKADEPVPDALIQKYEMDYSSEIVKETRAYPGIPEALDELSRNGHIFIFTKKPVTLSRLQLEGLDLMRYISEIIGRGSHAEMKPAAAPVEAALRHRGLQNSERFMIGDSQLDMIAARNIHAEAIWCKWGYYKEVPVNPSPDVVAREPSDLPKILLH